MGRFRLKIEDFQKTANENGGFCLTKEYFGLNQKMDWLCSAGHFFTSRAEDVRRGSWCKECSKIKNSKKRKEKFLKMVQEKAASKGGICLSEEYIDKNHKMKMQCSEGHIWETRPHDLLRDHWCAKCIGNAKLSIKDCKKIAKEREGLCLSTDYKNSKDKITWQCENGHVFKTSLALINYGYWCPFCKNKTEALCKEFLEDYFDCKFVKVRPSWLIGVNGHPLELDGYCESLKLAFEYNGIQHYQPVDFFGGVDRFKTIKKNDQIKKKLCKKNNVKLIVIDTIKKPTKKNVKTKIMEILFEKFSDC